MQESNDCIRWKKAKNPNGYGVTRFDGRNTYAHRAAYCKHHGIKLLDIEGKIVRHKCDVRDCVNPLHLEIGTQMENVLDMIRRGRQIFGSRHRNSKLTEDDVAHIRKICVVGDKDFGCAAIAKKYGVSRSQISLIVMGRSWKHSLTSSGG